MSQKRIKAQKRSAWRRDDEAIRRAAAGQHGLALGFGNFLRCLPQSVLKRAAFDLELLLMITIHAKAVIIGNPRCGCPREEIEAAIPKMERYLVYEHLRRIGMLRARYPQDPFGQRENDLPQCAFWRSHPMAVALRKRLSDEETQKVLFGVIETRGDLRILQGHVVLLPTEDQRELADALEAMEEKLPKLLDECERVWGDSTKLAWTEPLVDESLNEEPTWLN